MPSLIIHDPRGKKKSHQLFKKMTTIGASNDNDITLDSELIGETHAVIHFDGRGFNIQISKRKLILEINGKKRRKVALNHRDELLIGDHQATFLLYDEPAEAEETGSEALDAYRKLFAFSRDLAGDRNITSLLDRLLDYIIELTNADKGFLILLEDKNLNVKVARNMKRETILDAKGQISDSIVDKVIKNKQPIIVSDALHDNEFNSSLSVVSLKLCSVMCVPLLDQGALLGLIYVGNDNVVNLFEQKHLDLLTIFAAQASLLVSNALLLNDLQLRNRALEERLDDIRFGSIIGTCPPMRKVFRRVEKVACTSVTVLIQGETGTGKELIAKEIHERSPRSKGPFVTINCGAIPETLLESELFGHVRGAFTGATATKPGKFQQADGGTLFLDEIGEMPLNLQVKLLRVLQEREVTKVGGTKADLIDIRVVAATNRDLESCVADGEFREDLFYRINVVSLQLPPLRERGDDIILLAKYLLKKYCKEYNLPQKSLSREAAVALRKYQWPGNIRQLENRLKKATILAERAVITPEDLDLMPEVLEPIKPLSEAKDDFQRRYINEVLELNDGNRTKTAKDLGVDPRTIFRHLEKEAER